MFAHSPDHFLCGRLSVPENVTQVGSFLNGSAIVGGCVTAVASAADIKLQVSRIVQPQSHYIV